MPLLLLSISWLTGIYLGTKVSLPLWIMGTGALPLLMIPFLRKYMHTLILAAAAILIFAGGCLLGAHKADEFNELSLAFYNDKDSIIITGMVETEPDVRDRSIEFQFKAANLYQNNIKSEITGKALVKTLRTFEYHYGDIIKIRGNAVTPLSYEDFDYKEYLSRDGMYSLFSYPSIELIDRNKGCPVLSAIYTVRNSLYTSLSKTLPEPQCSLAQGILLGTTSSIPYALKQDFNTTGTTHLLAISGLNLSIILGILLSLGIWLFGKNHALYIWLALIAIWLYSMLTGMKPPIVRSAVMGSMFLLAEFLGRQQNSGIILLFTAAVMAGLNTVILEDPSFQLSFVSMAGLIFIYPKLRSISTKNTVNSKNLFGRDRFGRFVLDSTLITVSAILTTWPLVAYYFGIISLSGLPATFLALPAMPYIIITVAITGIIGIFATLPAQITGWVAWLFLSYFLAVIELFAAIPFSWIQIGEMPILAVICYYVILSSVVLIITYRQSLASYIPTLKKTLINIYEKLSAFIIKTPKKYTVLPLLIISILLWTAIITLPDNNLHVSILNIGQGDAILIQTPGNKTILIDGGPSPQSIKIELSKKMPFWNRTIDLMIITQPQADHITGLFEVLQCYTVKEVMETGLPYNSIIYNKILNAIHEDNIEYRSVHSDQQIQVDSDTTIDILFPPQFIQTGQNNINDNSLVLRLNYKNRHFLLTGDISQSTEYYLISQRSTVKSDVLKIAHHGSRTSTSEDFLESVKMKSAVISAGANNTFGHPHQETMDRLIKYVDKNNILVTSHCGTVEFITDGDRLWVKTNN